MKIYSLIVLAAGISLLGSCSSGAAEGSKNLNPVEFNAALEKESGEILLDVRTPGEYSKGALKGALNIDYNGSDFEQKVGELDKTATYYVYCLSGGRSESAVDWMLANGFSKVFNMSGGIMAWQASDLPVESGEAQVDPGMSLADFNEILAKDSLILIDFYAPWCAPCKKMEPFLNELSTEYQGKVGIVRIDVDAHKELAGELGIEEIPVLATYRNGKQVTRVNGMHEKQELKALIDAL